MLDIIREQIRRQAESVGLVQRREEPVDLNIWMPAERVPAYLGVLQQTVDDLIRNGRLKSMTRTSKLLRNRKWETITATFVDKAQVEQAYQKSISSMTTVIEGTSTRVESDQKAVAPIVVQPTEGYSKTERVSDEVPMPAPWGRRS